MNGCVIIPFPQARRRKFIARAAARIANSRPKNAKKILAATLNQQAETMARKGIAAAAIRRERQALEAAIQAEFWHQILVPGGAG